MSNPVDTPIMERKFKETCGYLVFKNSFTRTDVCNARWRYRRKIKDPDFPITFTRKDYSIIQNKLPAILNEREFWSAVVSPTQAFFDGDWRDYRIRGREFQTMQLCKLINHEEMLDALPEDKRDDAKVHALRELMKANIIKPKEKAEIYVPKPIKLAKKYRQEPAPSTEDVLKSLEELK